MTTLFIATICILLLVAYIFDLSASITKIPSVILLLLLGWTTQQLCTFFDVALPDFSSILPILGTLGLILIVLDGSLELQLNRSKLPLLKSSFLMAIVPLLIVALGIAFYFYYTQEVSFKNALTNVIPLCVISSAIAIPTVKNFSKYTQEFIIYESSLSDILGVLFFNFIALNAVISLQTVGMFFLQLLLIILVSVLSIFILSYLLNRIDHHIKYVPLILIVILIYVVSKEMHLPALVFILLFGLFLSNIDELARFKSIRLLKPNSLKAEIQKFKEIVIEATFLIRALFFILFGFLIKTEDVFNSQTIVWSTSIVMLIFIIRYLFLKMLKVTQASIVYIAPRGLITVLLFLSIKPADALPLFNNALIIQVILLSTLFMMFGLMFTKKEVEPILPNAIEQSE
ncbi:MAG: sodium:proton antiporter [Bacteroidetes bacterium]|jgi:cell volume regulation protein A|nr:sodium:proton antiporter [Bacteroidota bacterium]MBK9481453.1 sodium:proton antiporter [Bacteroidota bacterium]